MPNQATTVAALVEAVQKAVAYTFQSGTYGIAVQQVDIELQLVLSDEGGGELKWKVLTVGATHTDRQTQTLHLTWEHQELKLLGFDPPDVTEVLIRGLDAADIGVNAWNAPGLPLAFKGGQLGFELAVDDGGALSVAVLKAKAEQKQTHTVTLKFSALP